MIPIDAQTLRVLMDINALQSFGTVQSYAEQGTSSSLFNSMLNDMLTGSPESLSGETAATNSLRYSGQNPVFEPAMLASLIAISNANPATSTTATGYSASTKGNKYSAIIKQAAVKYDLPEDLISSIIKHESNFKNTAKSHAGAQGLMQLMPGTAKFLGVKDRLDPVQNINGGARYLRQMLNKFDGNLELALAAYNAGPGNVAKYGGIPPFKETQNYVKKVLNTFHT